VSPVEVAEEDLMGVIEQSIAAHPRSLQKRIGPSEIGIECDKRIIYKLAGVPEPDRGVAWKPAIGTAVHAQLEQWFEQANTAAGMTRWVTENSVFVGMIGDTPLVGSCDLFDVSTGTVIDWKIVGPKQILDYRANGPSQQYRVQAHAYGLGYFNDAGWGVPKNVGIMFLPRDGELSKRYFWHEPWNPALALDALNRVNRLDQLQRLLGAEQAAAISPGCTSRFCPICKAIPAERPEGQSLFTH
jgi:hypothetical protein